MQKKAPAQPDMAESRELLKSILRFMKMEQQLSMQELLALYTEVSPEEAIPVSVFAQGLSPSEALCKYLKENRGLSFHEIAVLLNRDDRSVWTSYARASGKGVKRLAVKGDGLLLPLSIFQDRSMSILENAVQYLRTNYRLSNSRIAELTKKNPASIATVASRAAAKASRKVAR